MDILGFLNRMEFTLNDIEVKGRDNLDKLYACMLAIDQMRQEIAMSANAENNTAPNKDGEEQDGRQADIGAPASVNSTVE